MRNHRGILLVTVIVLTGALAAMAAAIFMFGLARSKANSTELASVKASSMADGGTDLAGRVILDAIANHNTVPADGYYVMNGDQLDYTIAEIGTSWVQTDSVGLQTLNQQYRIRSQAASDGVPTIYETIVTASRIPVFQFLAYYDGDLEIQPGPTMVAHGRIHANSDIYIGAGASLTVDSNYFKTAGSFHRRRKDNGTQMGGTVSINAGSGPVAWDLALESSSSNWVSEAFTNWGDVVQDGTNNGVQPMSVPNVETFAIGGYYNQVAESGGLVILDGQAFQGGTNITGLLPAGTITTETIYDGRENLPIVTTKVNIALLNASGHFPANGLMYAARTDCTQSQPNAIQLTNGAELQSGLTVVSENPVYIKGDYNTVNKKGAAVICDAVNLLSNSWNNSKTAGTLPTAGNTSYNLCFVAGNVPTPNGGGPYSGGFENYVRFHENWSGRNCVIRGSFVSLAESQKARGLWVYGDDNYTAPNRDWDFDPDLNDPSNLPPQTPEVVAAARVSFRQITDEGLAP